MLGVGFALSWPLRHLWYLVDKDGVMMILVVYRINSVLLHFSLFEWSSVP